MAKQFWVRIDGREQGPYSSGQLKQFAEQGKLQHQHEVSTDQVRWVPASSVKGLPLQTTAAPIDDPFSEIQGSPADDLFPGKSDDWPLGDAAPLPSDELWDDLPSGATASQPVYGPPSANAASMPAHMAAAGFATASSSSAEEQVAPGSTESMVFSWPAGTAMGTVVGVVLLLSGCVLTALVAAVMGDGALAVAAVVLVGVGGMVLAGAVFACSGYGSTMTIALTANGPGRATCNVTRRLAFLPVKTEEFLVTKSDILYKQIKEGGTFILSPTSADIFMLLLIFVMCFIGLIPGVIFWVMWWNSRNDAQHCYCDVALTLKAENRGGFLRLWQQRVREYRATRFGDPTELEKLMKMFARFAGPRLVVEEM